MEKTQITDRVQSYFTIDEIESLSNAIDYTTENTVAKISGPASLANAVRRYNGSLTHYTIATVKALDDLADKCYGLTMHDAKFVIAHINELDEARGEAKVSA
jgi:hypothetical protein